MVALIRYIICESENSYRMERFMVKLLKYLRGYLRIRLWGFSPERFMNLCSNREILLWDITKEGDEYVMCISLRSFYRLKPIVKKTGTRVAILERYGLPFLLPKLLKRKTFLAGFLFTILFWIGSSLFIWDIELVGNYQITEDMFQSFLMEQNVKVGMRKEKLDIESLEKDIRKAFSQVTWTSVKLSGTKLEISIKENDAPIIVEQNENGGGKDLVSECDGVIVSMIVREGVPKVAIGDTVEPGTILVEGSIPVYNEDTTVREYQYVQSDADIMVEHTRTFQEKLPFDYIKKEYTGRTKKKYFLRFGEKKLAMPENQPFLVYDSLIKESCPLAFEKLGIPLFWGSYTHREYQNVECEYTLEQAETILNEKLNTFLITLEEKGVQIMKKNVKIDTSGGMWVIDATLQVRELVGKCVDIIPKDIINPTNGEELHE